MNTTNIDTLNTFTISSIPNLDIAVLGALELFTNSELPSIDFDKFNRPLVVGSGNAEATGRILFSDKDAVFGSESSAEEQLKSIETIDSVVVVSASGSKHAPLLVNLAHDHGKKVALITNTADSAASKELDEASGDKEYVFPKNREPYTYNTSTYMGMILGKTNEDSQAIYNFIKTQIDTMAFPDFSKFQKYYLIIPPEFSGMIRFLQLKFVELFGRNIAQSVETSEYIKHATTVAPVEDELFISFGSPNTLWGKPENRLYIPLPDNADYAAMMAISYYVVSKIQFEYEHFFKDNIATYTTEISKVFNSTITPIVEK